MSSHNDPRIQKLFLAALEMSADQRDGWLVEQCGDDHELLTDIRELFAHDDITDDPLEKGLKDALVSFPSTEISPHDGAGTTDESFKSMVGSDEFLSKLSQVGVLSPEEVHELSRSFANGEDSVDPRLIATQLVSQGKLTDYQASALLQGQPELLIDKYLILDLLDAGGMGMVFKAIHRPMNRTVAIKMISKQLLSSPEQVKRFLREVRVAATLEHPNIVRSYDADQSNGAHFLVMEYVRGDNLTRIVRNKGPLSVKDGVDCIFQAAQGLRYAHKRGIIHRDIKPGNLMRTRDGLVKVLDLGLANIDESFRLAQQSSAAVGEADSLPELTRTDLTAPGTVLGTVSYMAPEQTLDANLADTRSDIYSLGCTLYFLLVGETPYKGDTVFQVFLQHRDGQIPEIRSHRPDVPIQVDLICQKMLAKEPEQRYQSMGELITAIEDCELDLPDQRRRRKKRRRSGPKIEIDASQTSYVRSPKDDERETTKTMLWGAGAFACLLFVVLGLNHFLSPDNNDNAVDQLTVTHPNHTEDQSGSHPEVDPIPMQVSTTEPQYGLHFDGDGDFVELPSFEYDGKTPLTIEFWYQAPRIQDNLQAILSIDGLVWIEGFTAGEGWRLRGRQGTRVFNEANAFNTQTIDQRIHLAIVFDGSSAEIFLEGRKQPVQLLRWDGELESRSPVDSLLFPIEHRFNNGKSVIGGVYTNSGTKQFLGTIDEVRISTSALYNSDFTPADRFEVDDDTLALYHFDEGEGDVLHDSSGNGHHGKIVGAQWVRLDKQPQIAQVNHALRFDGDDDYVELPTVKDFGTEPFTVEMCLTINGEESTTLFSSSAVMIELGWLEEDAYWVRASLSKGFGIGHWATWQINRLKLSSDQRHHLAFTFDGEHAQVFLNGILASDEMSFYQHDKSIDSPLPSDAIQPVSRHPDLPTTIGRNIRPDSNDDFFNGTVDELRISTSARYTGDFTPVDRFEADDDTLALYHFDEGKGDVLHDSSGNGHHGKIFGAQWVRLDEQPQLAEDRALRFDDGAVNLHEFDWKESATFTWEAKVSLDDDRWTAVFAHQGENSKLYLARGTTLAWDATAKNGDNLVLSRARADVPIVPGKTYQIALVRHGEELLLFVDGHLESRVGLDSDFKLPSAILRVGGHVGSYGDSRLSGTIDEIRFSNIARYTEDYTPVDRFESDEHTIALYHCDTDGDTLIDSSGNGYHVDLEEAVDGNVSRIKVYEEANMSAADLLATGEYEWRVVKHFGEPINGPNNDAGASISADGLTMIIASRREGGQGDTDLWISTRDSKVDNWSRPENLGDQINTALPEHEASVSADGSTIYFHRAYRKDLASQSQPVGILYCERLETGEWSVPRHVNIGAEPEQLRSPTISSDELAMCVSAPFRSHKLLLTRRRDRQAEWPEPVSFGDEINADSLVGNGAISPDGRMLIFDRKDESSNKQNLWISSRDSSDGDWGAPIPISSLNSVKSEINPCFFNDGKSLLFASNRPGGNGNLDIYLARLVRKKSLIAWPSSVDLLQEVELKHAVIRNEDDFYVWSNSNSEISVDARSAKQSQGKRTSLAWPYHVEGDYRLTLELTLKTKGQCYVNLPLGEQSVNLNLHTTPGDGSYYSGLDHRGETQNEQMKLLIPSKFTYDEKNSIAMTVIHDGSDVSIEATLNGMRIANYFGPRENLRSHSWNSFPNGKPGVDCYSTKGLTIHSATLQPLTAADLLNTGEYEWQLEGPLPEPINSHRYENCADMTSDGLTIVFSSTREPSEGDADLWVAHRTDRDGKWSEPKNLGPVINSPLGESQPSLSDDALSLYFTRGSIGEQYRVYTASRRSLTAPWSQPTLLFENENIQAVDVDSTATRIVAKGNTKRDKDIFVSERESPNESWGPLRDIESLNTDLNENGGTMSDDGRLLMFTRDGDGLVKDLWMATRDNTESEWSPPIRLDGLSSDTVDLHPRLSPDGKSLLFASTRVGRKGGGSDVYRARLVRKAP